MTGAPPWNRMQVPQMLKIDLPHDPAAMAGHTPRELEFLRHLLNHAYCCSSHSEELEPARGQPSLPSLEL